MTGKWPPCGPPVANGWWPATKTCRPPDPRIASRRAARTSSSESAGQVEIRMDRLRELVEPPLGVQQETRRTLRPTSTVTGPGQPSSGRKRTLRTAALDHVTGLASHLVPTFAALLGPIVVAGDEDGGGPARAGRVDLRVQPDLRGLAAWCAFLRQALRIGVVAKKEDLGARRLPRRPPSATPRPPDGRAGPRGQRHRRGRATSRSPARSVQVRMLPVFEGRRTRSGTAKRWPSRRRCAERHRTARASRPSLDLEVVQAYRPPYGGVSSTWTDAVPPGVQCPLGLLRKQTSRTGPWWGLPWTRPYEGQRWSTIWARFILKAVTHSSTLASGPSLSGSPDGSLERRLTRALASLRRALRRRAGRWKALADGPIPYERAGRRPRSRCPPRPREGCSPFPCLSRRCGWARCSPCRCPWCS